MTLEQEHFEAWMSVSQHDHRRRGSCHYGGHRSIIRQATAHRRSLRYSRASLQKSDYYAGVSDSPERALLNRLNAEREEAYRRYNEALSDLDRARQKSPDWPDPPPRFDDALVTPINEAWNILPEGKLERLSGWRGRLADVVWQVVEPFLKRQVAFNGALVDHLNRNVKGQRDTQDALARALPEIKESVRGLVQFELLLMHLWQQVIPLLDTRERATHDAIAELRAVTDVAQRAAAMTRRELERVAATAPAADERPSADRPARAATADAFKYVAFEDRFRGSEDEIRVRLADYVPYFQGTTDVLDIGCGRGEFLDLLERAGIRARGLDLNSEMVEVCRARGLDVVEADALDYLSRVSDESLGGVIAVQVVEHLQPEYLTRLLQTAFYKLKPGARLILETINPACWVAFFESYLRDLTHVRPIHADTLQHLLHASGFTSVDIVYRAPIGEDARLQRVSERTLHFGEDASSDPLTELATAFNRNVDRLNSRMFTYQDFAAVASRP
jgi:SAM-dependent methyltransferase